MYIHEPALNLYTSLTDEEKLILSEASHNPVLQSFLNKCIIYYQEQLLDLSDNLTPNQLYDSYHTYKNEEVFIKYLLLIFADNRKWFQEVHQKINIL